MLLRNRVLTVSSNFIFFNTDMHRSLDRSSNTYFEKFFSKIGETQSKFINFYPALDSSPQMHEFLAARKSRPQPPRRARYLYQKPPLPLLSSFLHCRWLWSCQILGNKNNGSFLRDNFSGDGMSREDTTSVEPFLDTDFWANS